MRERKPTKLLQKIFDIRKKKKVTLAELGKVLGDVKGSTASDIENGYIPLKAQYLPAIAKLLGVQVWELFVDYQKGELGPLSEEEKAHILGLRSLDPQDRQKIEDIFQLITKHQD